MSRRDKRERAVSDGREPEAPAVDQTTETLPPPEAAKAVARRVVAKGRSLSTARGILPPGTEVQAIDCGANGEASLAALIAAGIVEEVSL